MSLFDLVDGIAIETDDTKAVAGAQSVVPVEMSIVTAFVRSEADTPERVEGRSVLVLPTQERLIGSTFELDMSEERGARMTVELTSLPVKGSGMYCFQTELKESTGANWKTAGSTPIFIDLLDITRPTKKKIGSAKAKASRKKKN